MKILANHANKVTKQGVVLRQTDSGDYVTHRYHAEQPGYFWGHYFIVDREVSDDCEQYDNAMRDFKERAKGL